MTTRRLLLAVIIVLTAAAAHAGSLILMGVGDSGGAGGPGDTPFVTGVVPGSLRNNYTGPVGFQIDVGANNLTVTQLGRWVAAGNALTHLLSIFDSSCSSLGSVTVNTSGATAGQFLYGVLSPSITLSAGQTYYVMSAEVSAGDQWSDESVATTTAAGTIASAYSASCVESDPGFEYVPMNFLYH